MELHEFGSGFRRARLEAAERLNREDFRQLAGAAREIGISESGLKQLESGKKRPSFETLLAMAKAYNVGPGDLLPSDRPSGPQVDKIVGPLATLPAETRGRFITQMAAFARMLASEMRSTTMREVEYRQPAVTDDGDHTSFPVGMRPGG